MENKRKQYVIIFAILIGIYVVGQIYRVNSRVTTDFLTTATDNDDYATLAYEVDGSSQKFEKVWDISDVTVWSDERMGYMGVKNEAVFFWGNLHPSEPESLIALNLSNASVKWEMTRRGRGIPLGFGHDDHAIYTSFEYNVVSAYSIETGEAVWESTLTTARNFGHIITLNNEIQTVSGTGYFFVLDASDGTVQFKEYDGSRLFMDGDMTYVYSGGIKAINDSEEIIWKFNPTEPVIQTPVIQNNTVYLRTGVYTLGQIHAINQGNGEVLWETLPNNVISNVAVSDGIAYYLTLDLYLRAVDAQSGELLDKVKFQPSNTINIEENHYFVAADNSNVVIYLDDTNQLFSFHFTSEE